MALVDYEGRLKGLSFTLISRDIYVIKIINHCTSATRSSFSFHYISIFLVDRHGVQQ